LSETGIEQAHGLTERVREVHFTAAFSSDLQRAAKTAEIVAADTGVEVELDARLREIDAGLWEGLTAEEAKERFPQDWAERERDLVGHRFPGGESFRELEHRVMAAFLDIVRRGGERPLIVAHLGVNRVLLGHSLGLPLEKLFSFQQEYCGVEILRVREDGRRG
jgi:probable phosphoglycerate mutase